MLLSLKQSGPIAPTSFHDAPRPIVPVASSRNNNNNSNSAYSSSSSSSTAVTHVAPPAPRAAGSPRSMSAHHRGLPLPAAMSLPAPSPAIPVPPSMGSSMSAQPMGQLPAPPPEWRNAEESMRNWLQARQEEDKRKQEEEKTRQETLRLEQRKIEQSMLHESLQGGIPPYLIPMVFAGMGGGNLANASLEWAQHYLAQAQHHLQPGPHAALPQPHSSPESRRDSRESRVLGSAQQSPYVAQQTSMPHGTPGGPQPQPQPSPAGSSQQGTPFMGGYNVPNMSPAARPGAPPPPPPSGAGQTIGPTSAPRPPAHAVLPRLTTGEIHIQPSPHGPAGMSRPGPAGLQQVPAQAAAAAAPTAPVAPPPEPPQQSPSISFLHWQPPLGSKESKEPGTPDYTNSPKKRKAQGSHQAAPPPSGQGSFSSPPLSQAAQGGPSSGAAASPNIGLPSRRPAHGRQRSDASTRGDLQGRPPSRSRLGEGNGGGGSGRGTTPSAPSGHGPHETTSGALSEVSAGSQHSPGRRSSRQSLSSQAGPSGPSTVGGPGGPAGSSEMMAVDREPSPRHGSSRHHSHGHIPQPPPPSSSSMRHEAESMGHPPRRNNGE